MNRIKELFGINYPIIQSALSNLEALRAEKKVVEHLLFDFPLQQTWKQKLHVES